MRIVRGIANLPAFPDGCVATIGTFDGVHLGHQALISELAEQGRRLSLPVAVVLFEPQPREYFQPRQCPARLYRLREKIGALAGLPVDWVLLLRFDHALAQQTAEDFVRRIFIDGLRVKHVLIGDDFRFGRERRGDVALLRKTGLTAGFDVASTPTFVWENADGRERRVSSTWIREALNAGDCALAARLLGRPYAISGRVVHGNQRGRELGYPTANLALRRKATPVNGVFAVTLCGIDGREWPGVANVGTRPTVKDDETALLEVHLFDFDRDIYQQQVEVRFHHKLRDERRFSSFDALRDQIRLDAEQAGAWLARRAETLNAERLR